MTRSLRLILGGVTAALAGLVSLTPVILAGITFNGID
jgi:hypothetical protein